MPIRSATARRHALLLECLEERATPAIAWSVSFEDPQHLYTAFYDSIRANLIAAGHEWGRYFHTAKASIELNVRFQDLEEDIFANAGSDTTVFFQNNGKLEVREDSVGYEIRAGKDPNGSGSDATITLDPNSLANEMWFDPTPENRLDEEVPYNKEDAFSLFLHELGHTLGFSGWRDWTTGKLSDKLETRFDRFVTVAEDGTPYFNGPAAKAVYNNQNIPLTYSNLYHVGNDTFNTEDGNGQGHPGDDLMDDVMSGTGQDWGSRTWISALDIAMLQDIGLPISNAAPTISALPDQFIPTFGTGKVKFSVQDAETPAENLSLRVTSSDNSLFPEQNLGLQIQAGQASLSLYPAYNGLATITVHVSDGVAETTRSFDARVAIDQFPWRNPLSRLDVTNDREINALDALVIINRLNGVGAGPLPWRELGAATGQFYDVDTDNSVTANDALIVINYLNDPLRRLEQNVLAAEGESSISDDVWLLTTLENGSVGQVRGKPTILS